MGHPNVNVKNQKAGGAYIADTAAHVGQWDSIQALSAAIANLTAGDLTGNLTAVPIPAGTMIHGTFTGITLASGAVIAYNSL